MNNNEKDRLETSHQIMSESVKLPSSTELLDSIEVTPVKISVDQNL